MPQTVYTAFDTGGQTKLTDMDQVAERRRQEAQDQAFRGALLNNQNNMQREGWDRQNAMTQQGLTAQERIAAANNANQLAMGGSFQDRTAANAAQLSAQMRPAQTLADLEREKWGAGAALRDAESAGKVKRLSFENGIFDQISGGGAAGGQPIDPKQLRLAMAFMNKDPNLLQDPNDNYARELIKSQVAAGTVDPVDAMAALKSGNYGGMPRKQVSAIAPEQQVSALESRVSGFGEKDAATFGFDPTENDVQDIVRQRDQVAQALKSQRPQLSPEQAMEGANWIIEQRLLPNQDRWGTEWIGRLRQALRSGAAPAAQAAPARTGGLTGPAAPMSNDSFMGAGG